MNSPFLKIACLVSVLTVCGSRGDNVGGSTLYGMLAYPPIPPFAGINPGQGHAKLGGGVGLDYAWPMTLGENLGFILGIACAFNPVNTAGIVPLRPGDDVKMGYWLSAPILAGFKFQVTSDPVDYYAMVQGGAVMASLTDSRIGRQLYVTPTGFSYASGAGLGFIVNQKIDFGIKLLHMGQPDYKGQVPGLFVAGKQKPLLVTVSVGIHVN